MPHLNTTRLLLYLLTFSSLASLPLAAEIGIAVAKDRNGSSIAYRYEAGDFRSSSEAETKARRRLRSEGYRDVYTLSGSTNAGHNIERGVFIIVRTRYRDSDGNTRVSYGLGASEDSWNEAEERALRNLSTYAWNWSRQRHGYEVIERGEF